MTTAVLILSQPHEAAVARLTLTHLKAGIGDATVVLTLVNGGGVAPLRDAVGDDPRFEFLGSPTNLGVAGGRRALLEHPIAVDAEYVVILDNDIIPPIGLCDRLTQRLADRPDVGVLGAAIFDWNRIGARFPLGEAQPIDNEVLAHCHRFGNPDNYFHLGTSTDWQSAYLDERALTDIIAEIPADHPDRFVDMNHQDRSVVRRLAQGDFRDIAATNIAGACQAFRRSLVDEIGSVDEIFSPYGFEDVDFCVRAVKAGYRNIITPDICMIHGTDSRHVERQKWAANVANHRNVLRVKTLFAHRHAQHDYKRIAERALLRRLALVRQGPARRTRVLLRSGWAGIQDAERQLAMEKVTLGAEHA